ncbi:hypothetical protein QTP88_022759 [Uroleucon formosanum]
MIATTSINLLMGYFWKNLVYILTVSKVRLHEKINVCITIITFIYHHIICFKKKYIPAYKRYKEIATQLHNTKNMFSYVFTSEN